MYVSFFDDEICCSILFAIHVAMRKGEKEKHEFYSDSTLN